MNENIVPYNHKVQSINRVQRNGHKSYLLWFTGLSGSGKSTIASALEKKLFEEDYQTYILDGDNVRSGLNKDLDFSDAGRRENIRRISEVSKLFLDAGMVVFTAFISPFEEDRKQAKNIVGENNFIEVFIDTPLHICEQRDVKGLYKKARAGKIPNFTGIDSPFEAPDHPDIHVKTDGESVEESTLYLYSEFLKRVNKNS